MMKRNGKPKSNLILTSRVYPLRIPPQLFNDEEWKPFPIFNGITGGLRIISCHLSVLSTGYSPHTPHTHKEEELLLLLSGSLDLILPDRLFPGKNHCIHLEKGQFVYYPSYFAHTLQATSEAPANYLMFKWYTGFKKNNSGLAFSCFNMFGNSENLDAKDSFSQQLIFEGPTGYLRKLHCHTSILIPGAGYKPHRDVYDVSIIVLEGEIETLGQGAKPYDVVFYAAGEPHGINNPGASTAKYIVFEFHSYNRMLISRFINICAYIFTKMKDPERWKRKLKRLLNILYTKEIKLFLNWL